MSARLCLGRWQTGREFPTATPHRPAPAYGALAILEPEAPAGGMSVASGIGGRWGSTHALGPIPSCRGGRRRSGGGAGRRQERRPERSREARPAERSAAGCLDEVEKVLAARELSPWSLDETLDFLAAARKDPLYAAFVLAIALGFRRGEVVGLRWENVDLDKREIRVRTQRQRVAGEVYEDDPKGRRRKQTLPLPAICVAPLRWQRLKQAAARERAGEKWTDTGYVFTTRTGQPIEPRNLYRSFTRVAKNADLRVVRLHDARHGTATLLTAAGVPPRVVMEILGHSQIAVTMNVYTHVVQDTQREAVSHMDRLLRSRPRS
ncbi:site-specific integrase [Streptomyces sp. NPDC096030]|uniref:site-specific integrase n=1 Tax=Streptomyces sp. NPDC096030 TaxID=3155423 RepID=UPI003317C3FE